MSSRLRSLCILVILMLPMTFTKVVEFGIKLKEYGGHQDVLLLGFVNLYSKAESIGFKELVQNCLSDYHENELRRDASHSIIKMTGTVSFVDRPKLKGDKMKFQLDGDITNFQMYLSTMIINFYRKNPLQIRYYDLPIFETSRPRPAKVGEVITLDFDEVFTGFDDDMIVEFIIRSGGSDESGSNNSEISAALLPRRRKSSSTQSDSLCNNCNCCTIS